MIYGVKVVMEERIVSSSSCWGCPVDGGNYREPSFSFSSFSSDLSFFSFFFSPFFPHGSSPRGPYRSPPLSGILTVSIGTGWCERGSLDRWRTYPSFSAPLPFFVFQLPLLCGFPVFLVFCSIFSRLLARLFRSDFFLRFFYR